MPIAAEDVLLAYITCADAAEARRIAQALVTERLAACVHLRPHEAVYMWEGRLEQSAEYGLIAKTTRQGFAALAARVVALHSYDLPGIVAVAAADGHAPFLAWIGESTTPS